MTAEKEFGVTACHITNTEYIQAVAFPYTSLI